jgi:hypothetical protein
LVAAFNLWLVTARFPPLKNQKLTPPVVRLSKIFPSFSPMKSAFFTRYKFIFDFSFDPSPHLAYRHLMQNELLTAVADSTATGLPIDVTIHADSIESSIAFLRSRFMDVDWDTYPDRITIFGDDQRIPVSPNGDGDEGHFVLNLVFPVTAFVDTNAI